MSDLWNPTNDDVRRWAADPDAEEIGQDWDLALAAARHDRVYLELVGDPACPQRGYLLRVLYLIVGDAVRTGFRTAARDDIEALLARPEAGRHPDLVRWRERSRALLAAPETFTYAAWCAGGLAADAAT